MFFLSSDAFLNMLDDADFHASIFGPPGATFNNTPVYVILWRVFLLNVGLLRAFCNAPDAKFFLHTLLRAKAFILHGF